MKNIIISHGLIYGIITAVSALLFQYGITGMVVNALIGFPLMIILIISAGRKYKAANGGYATFGNLLMLFMGFLVFASILSALISFTHGQLISEETKETIIENVTESSTSLFGGFMPDELMTEMEDQMEEQTSAMFAPATLLMTILSSIFGSLIIGAIAAAIMKKSRPANEMLDGHL